MTSPRKAPAVVGWVAVGPMEAWCIDDAATEDAVRARYSNGEVEDVEPILVSSLLTVTLVCVECGEALDHS